MNLSYRSSSLVRVTLIGFAMVSSTLIATPALCQSEDSEPETPSIAEQVKGKWVLYRETPNGRFTTIKVHNGTESIVTSYDPNMNEVYSHRSEYTVDETGAACVFTYRNQKVLVGKDAGAVVPGPFSYLFRIDGERFLEVHGMMKGDKRNPSLTVWERLKDDPIKRPAT
ncbi:MAG: hypothetical protein ACR2NZ_05490 [Rubripirellula sp.]